MQVGDTPVDVENARRPHLTLRSDSGSVAGSGGCNRLFGTYALTGNGLRFSGLGSTKMACPDMEIETAFTQALERVDTWRIAGAELQLHDAQGVVLLRFAARATP
jgi:heat shock protein HslJ